MPSALQLTILLVLLAPTVRSLPQRPDLTGVWIEDATQRKTPHVDAGSGGAKGVSATHVPIVITQTSDTIAIERDFIERVKHVHHFDGREDTNRNGAQVHTTRTRWEGAKLVTEGTTFQSTSQGETYWKLKHVRWLTPKGELVVETTRIDEAGQVNTVVQVFKRKR